VALLVYGKTRQQPPATPATEPPASGDDPILAALESATPKQIRDMAQAIALAEGFGLPGAKPTRYHNPGDLTDSAGNIREFPDDTSGWRALYHQLGIITTGQSTVYDLEDDTIRSMGQKWTATEQDAWINNVVRGLRQLGYNVTQYTQLSDVLT
jgi:hypothetical protein